MKVNGLEEFIERLEKDYSDRLDKIANTTGKKLLKEVKKNTPVRKKIPNGQTGGRLRRSWKIAKKSPGVISIYNNTHYAPHVEYGHRTRSKSGGQNGVKYDSIKRQFVSTTSSVRIVPGVFMLRNSMEKIKGEIRKELGILAKEILHD